MRPYEVLICRIFEQAIEDYRELKDKKIAGEKDNSSCYSIRDIEQFFGSNWCTRLLEMIDSELTGNDILSRLQAQCA